MHAVNVIIHLIDELLKQGKNSKSNVMPRLFAKQNKQYGYKQYGYMKTKLQDCKEAFKNDSKYAFICGGDSVEVTE